MDDVNRERLECADVSLISAKEISAKQTVAMLGRLNAVQKDGLRTVTKKSTKI